MTTEHLKQFFDRSTGTYTAAVSGTYTFTIQKYGNNKQGSFNILLDKKQIVYTRHRDPSGEFFSGADPIFFVWKSVTGNHPICIYILERDRQVQVPR